MTTEKLALSIGKQIDRRRMLSRVGAGAVAAAFALLGWSREAEASSGGKSITVTLGDQPVEPLCHTGCYRYRCCNLCQAPGGCSGVCCAWCWTCCYNGTTKYRCCEGYACSHPCDGTCGSGWRCSAVYNIGSC